MTLEFRCSNAECNRRLTAPEQAVGRQVRCPACGTIQAVPEQPAAAPRMPAYPAVAPPPVPPPPPQPAAPPPVPETTRLGTLARDCFGAITYGVSNLGSMFRLLLAVFAVTVATWIAFGLTACLIRDLFVALGIILLGVVVCMGYYFRFYLNSVISSLEGTDEAPDVGPLMLGDLAVHGAKWLGVTCVYVLPVVTLPLLPIGLLGLAVNSDSRGFNVPWAVRAALKRPAHLGVLWAVLLFWWAVMGVGIYYLRELLGLAVDYLTAGEAFGPKVLGGFIGVIGALLAATLSIMFYAVLFRCVGLLGRACPELGESMPDEPTPGVSGVCIAIGVAVSVAVVLLVWPIFGFGLDTGG